MDPQSQSSTLASIDTPVKRFQPKPYSQNLPVKRFQSKDSSQNITVKRFQSKDSTHKIPLKLNPPFDPRSHLHFLSETPTYCDIQSKVLTAEFRYPQQGTNCCATDTWPNRHKNNNNNNAHLMTRI